MPLQLPSRQPTKANTLLSLTAMVWFQLLQFASRHVQRLWSHQDFSPPRLPCRSLCATCDFQLSRAKGSAMEARIQSSRASHLGRHQQSLAQLTGKEDGACKDDARRTRPCLEWRAQKHAVLTQTRSETREVLQALSRNCWRSYLLETVQSMSTLGKCWTSARTRHCLMPSRWAAWIVHHSCGLSRGAICNEDGGDCCIGSTCPILMILTQRSTGRHRWLHQRWLANRRLRFRCDETSSSNKLFRLLSTDGRNDEPLNRCCWGNRGDKVSNKMGCWNGHLSFSNVWKIAMQRNNQQCSAGASTTTDDSIQQSVTKRRAWLTNRHSNFSCTCELLSGSHIKSPEAVATHQHQLMHSKFSLMWKMMHQQWLLCAAKIVLWVWKKL